MQGKTAEEILAAADAELARWREYVEPKTRGGNLRAMTLKEAMEIVAAKEQETTK